MDVYNFLQSLNQSYSGNLGKILKNNGYLTDDISYTDTFLRDEQHNPQLYCSKSLRSLFQDMSDFVCQVVKKMDHLFINCVAKTFPYWTSQIVVWMVFYLIISGQIICVQKKLPHPWLIKPVFGFYNLKITL
jgi:hypothetical protein